MLLHGLFSTRVVFVGPHSTKVARHVLPNNALTRWLLSGTHRHNERRVRGLKLIPGFFVSCIQVSKGRDTGVSQVTGFTAKISMGNGMQVCGVYAL